MSAAVAEVPVTVSRRARDAGDRQPPGPEVPVTASRRARDAGDRQPPGPEMPVTVSRRTALVCALLAGSGLLPPLVACTPTGPPPADPKPPSGAPPPSPTATAGFHDFTLTESGGIDGRNNRLDVGADGRALLISRDPAGGRLSAERLTRLRTLLQSDQFRQEATRQPSQDPGVQCSDQVFVTITFGRLSMRRAAECGQAPDARPAYEEIVSLLRPALRGRFDAPLLASEAALPSLRLVRTDAKLGYTISVSSSGVARFAESGRPPESIRVPAGRRDALRLLAERIRATGRPGELPGCTDGGSYQLVMGAEPAVVIRDCAFFDAPLEYQAMVTALRVQFDR